MSHPEFFSLSDLSAVLSGQVWRLGSLSGELPEAIETVKQQLKHP